MAKTKKFRISTRYKEIFQVITAAQKNNSGNFIWKMIEGNRRIFPIDITKIDGDKNRIEVQTLSMTDKLKNGDELYLKLDSREAAFKTILLEMGISKMVLTFPDEVVLNENRGQLRHYFHTSDEKIVQIKRVRNQVSTLRERTQNAVTFDISETGLSIYLPMSLSHFFEIRSRLTLEMIGPFRLSKPIVGEVVFKMPFEMKGIFSEDLGFKLGIQLDRRIPKEILERFVLKKHFSITDEEIVKDEAFRRKVRTQIKGVTKNLASKKAFKDFFAALEIQRGDHQYLKQHIELLCEVMAGLGTKLGWVSEKTIEKLIYAAYLHDIRLMKCPKVARIQNKKEFGLISKELTETERKAFLEAPAYAAEVARQDTESYPDVIKILSQQKELPDGSGFPSGVTSIGMAPLSCLFILSHYFVDYVMNHADWTTADFVKTYRNQLKGSYFAKIFQVMR